MKYSQYRAFELTASFFYLFRNVRYMQVPVVRAMGYAFHRRAEQLYRRSRPLNRRWVVRQQKLYDKLVGNDKVVPVPYRAMRNKAPKIAYSVLVTKGLEINQAQSITCIEKKSRRRLSKSFYNPEARGRLQGAQYRLLLRKIRLITRKRGIHPYFKSRAFMRWIRIQLRSVMRKINGIHRLFAQNNIRGVVQFSSVNPMGYLLVHMGKQRRIPTINVQYGLNDTYQLLSTNIDHYIAWGEQHQKRLTQYGAPKSKFHLLGNARFDPIFNNKWMTKKELLRRLSIREDKTVFVYPEQPLPPQNNRLVMRRILQALAPYRKKVILLVKKHPRQRASGLTNPLMRKYRFARIIRHRSIQLYDLLNSADAVFVQFSTSGLEAMLFRKPVISLAFSRDTNKHEYSYYASSKQVTSARGIQQLKAIMNPFMTSGNYRRRILSRQQPYCNSAYNGGTQAKRKIKQFIQNVTGVRMEKVTAVIPVSADSYTPVRLIRQTIQEARRSGAVDRIVITTDRQDLTRHLGRGIKFVPVNTSSLHTSNDSFIELSLQHLDKEISRSNDNRMIIFLQPNFPFRTGKQIARAVQLFINSQADTLRSVSAPAEGAEPEPNGAIVISRASTLNAGRLLGQTIYDFHMPVAQAFEVQSEEDDKRLKSLRPAVPKRKRLIRKTRRKIKKIKPRKRILRRRK